ncbi:D-glycero-beta-D-manno-heptose 1-phosphate adenylyltransferase [bacterium]|nr:D-glycero-beta-D-manno-heptose 1-phosphate adenylyltransferase [bacterium]
MNVYTVDTIASKIADWEAEGGKTVFTNGCFDLMHVGHVRYLQAARQLGDRLVVGLNSDRSVKELKGPARPILPEEERAELLAALGCVDAVVVFDERTADRAIEAVRPALYAKGGDYEPDTIPETPLVRSLGGEVVVLPFVEGRSTTSLIARIKANG